MKHYLIELLLWLVWLGAICLVITGIIWFFITWNEAGMRITDRFNQRCQEIGGQPVEYRKCINNDHVELYIPPHEYYPK